MSALIIAVAVAATIAVPALLVAVTGGRDLVHTEHDLPKPARHARRASTSKGVR